MRYSVYHKSVGWTKRFHHIAKTVDLYPKCMDISITHPLIPTAMNILSGTYCSFATLNFSPFDLFVISATQSTVRLHAFEQFFFSSCLTRIRFVVVVVFFLSDQQRCIFPIIMIICALLLLFLLLFMPYILLMMIIHLNVVHCVLLWVVVYFDNCSFIEPCWPLSNALQILYPKYVAIIDGAMRTEWTGKIWQRGQ